MYLNLGKDLVIPDRNLIGIFDLDNCSSSYLTREFLSKAQKNQSVINTAEDLPASFVLCWEKDHKNEQKHGRKDDQISGQINDRNGIFLCQSTSRTLAKRVEQLQQERRVLWRKTTN